MLELAGDADLPVLERVKLCGLVSRNLDEFFSIRIAGLLGSVRARLLIPSPDGRLPMETIAECRDRVLAIQAAQAHLWLHDLKPALAREKIRIVSIEDCGPRELTSLARRFRREIEPLLTPIALGAATPFPFIPSLALNIGVFVLDPVTRDRRFVRVNVPAGVSRFVPAGRGTFVLVEEVILEFLRATARERPLPYAVFRITRDADLSISRDTDDMLEAVETQLLRRRFANVVRLEVGAGTPGELVALLTRELQISPQQVYEVPPPVGLGSLHELAELDRPDLNHPYDSFDSSVGEFVAAARDPKVAALKATVYRMDSASPTLASLVQAAEEDKQAVCLVELKARFDERRNIDSSRTLERAGVNVVFGAPDLKVHAKLALLVRRERGAMRRYAHIGTGNYHVSNASNYEDLGLFTADDEIAADVADVFNAVTSRTPPLGFRKLLVGPWYLRDGVVREIGRITAAALAGTPARIRIKVNSLVDPEIVDALYDAATAGASVEVIARGICVLQPGLPALGDRITVRSVLGRFLEHSRILWFETDDEVSVWIGSADLMPRNLDHRVEVLVPIEDARMRAEIGRVLDALGADTRFAWTLDRHERWKRVEPEPGAARVSAQETLMQRAVRRAKKG